MKQSWINALAFGGGVLLGPYSLLSAIAEQPPPDWQAITIVFVCMSIASLLVTGTHFIGNDPKYSKSVIIIFTLLSFLTFGMGVSGFAYSIYNGEFDPLSLIYLAFGAAMLVGAIVSKLIFNAKFSDAL